MLKTYSLAGAHIEIVSGASKKDPTRPAHTAMGAGAGLLLAGPIGALVGGAVGFVGAKGTQEGVVFHLTLADGRQATCHGTMQEYARAEAAIRRATKAASSARTDRLPPSLADRDRIRAGLAEAKAAAHEAAQGAPPTTPDGGESPSSAAIVPDRRVSALTGFRKLTAEEKRERNARKKAVTAQGLPMRETMRILNAIDAEYR